MNIPNDIFRKSKKKRLEIPTNMLANNMKDIPDQIVIKYQSTIDVCKIDEILHHKMNVLKKKKLDISNYDEYVQDAPDLIHEYELEKSDVILQRYLDLCSKYISIECIRKNTFKLKCKGCEKELESDEENDDNIYVCSDCECINTFLKPNTYSRIGDRFIMPEDDTVNFIKVLDKFEGKNEPHPPESLYEDLDDYFLSMKMKCGDYYKRLPLNDKGKKDDTSKKKLWDALEHTGNNRYYDESNFIAHRYWGWELPDITLFRDKLIVDYQETQNVWNKIKHNYNRSASLGTQFRLFVHLKAIGYECNREDFKIQDMVESLRLHNDAWKIMCEETGLNYIFVS